MIKFLTLFLLWSTFCVSAPKFDQVNIVFDVAYSLVYECDKRQDNAIKTDLWFGREIFYCPQSFNLKLLKYFVEDERFRVGLIFRQGQKRLKKILKSINLPETNTPLSDFNFPYLENDDYTNVYSSHYQGTPKITKRRATKVEKNPHDIRELFAADQDTLILTSRTSTPVLNDDLNPQGDGVIQISSDMHEDEFWRVIGLIRETLLNPHNSSSARESLQEAHKVREQELIIIGEGYFKDPNWNEFFYHWDIDLKVATKAYRTTKTPIVTGCELHSKRKDNGNRYYGRYGRRKTYLKKVALKDCYEHLVSGHRFTYEADHKQVKACARFAKVEDDWLLIEGSSNKDPAVCLKENKSIYFWTDTERNQCGHFILYQHTTDDYIFFKEAKTDHCIDNHNRLAVWSEKTKNWFIIDYQSNFIGLSLDEIIHFKSTQLAISSMSHDFNQFVITLDRDVFVYNWRKLEDITDDADGIPIDFYEDEAIQLTDERVIRYAHTWRDAIFKHTPLESGLLGFGLYAANDPVSSSDYGGHRNFLLTEIKLPKNSRLLDIRSATSHIIVSKKTKDLLVEQLGCVDDYYFRNLKKYKGKQYYNIRKKNLTGHEACQNIFAQAIKQSRLAALIYRWGGVSRACDHPDKKSAFVILDMALDNTTIKGHVDTLTPHAPEHKLAHYGQLMTDFNYHETQQRHLNLSRLNNRFKDWSFPPGFTPLPARDRHQFFACDASDTQDKVRTP